MSWEDYPFRYVLVGWRELGYISEDGIAWPRHVHYTLPPMINSGQSIYTVDPDREDWEFGDAQVVSFGDQGN